MMIKNKIMILSLCICILFSACDKNQNDSPHETDTSTTPPQSESLHENIESKADDKLRVDFIDGPNGSNTASLAVGDNFLGLVLDRLDIEYNDSEIWMVQADFTGEVTLRGRLIHENIEGPNLIRFDVAEESQSLLPYPVGIERTVWFGFTDEAKVKEMVGQDFFDMNCEIVIDTYNIHFAYAGVWDIASLVSITENKATVTTE